MNENKTTYDVFLSLRDELVDYAAALRQYNKYGRDRRIVEEQMIEDMRTAQEQELEGMRSVIRDLASHHPLCDKIVIVGSFIEYIR